jgi:hypothetical protein
MSCALTQGFDTLDCKDNTGGVIEFLITELANLESITTTDGAITAITMAPGSQFWEYKQLKETADWTEDLKATPANGTIAYNQTANLVLFKRDTEKRNEIMLLAQNTVAIIVKDKNGSYWLLGEEQGCDLADGSKYASGKAGTDKNGWDLVFSAVEHEPAKEVDGTLISTLLIPHS